MSGEGRRELARQYEFRSWRDYPLMNVSKGNMLHNRTGSWRFLKPIYEDKIPACQNACPAGNDIEGWIRLLKEGEPEKAFWHLKREQPFPSILGRVCFKFCQGACNRAPHGGSIMIRELERFIGEQVPAGVPNPGLPDYHGKSLVVIGSGPAGMSAAYFSRMVGFRVTILEAYPRPGGLLRYGIPAYRLPRSILDAEFEGLRNMGIEIRTGIRVGEEMNLVDVTRQYDYVFLATGASRSLALNVDGFAGEGVMSGLTFLSAVSMCKEVELGREVAVIGGGNTAIDVARTAIRLGCKVTVIYRRTRDQMPAHEEEVEEAEKEGVVFIFLAVPERIESNSGGFPDRLVCSRMKLGDIDNSGRPRPIRIDDSLFDLKVDNIITCIGEQPDLDYLSGHIATGASSMIAGVDQKAQGLKGDETRVFGGGDMTGGQQTVIHAVGEGKRAAISMDCHRRGLNAEEVLENIRIGDGKALSFSAYMNWEELNPVTRNTRLVVDSSKVVYDYFSFATPLGPRQKGPSERRDNFEPYLETLGEEEAFSEAERCMHCGRCTECDNCLIFCPDISVLCNRDGGFGYHIDYDYCKGCGICFSECPRNAISMIEEDMS